MSVAFAAALAGPRCVSVIYLGSTVIGWAGRQGTVTALTEYYPASYCNSTVCCISSEKIMYAQMSRDAIARSLWTYCTPKRTVKDS